MKMTMFTKAPARTIFVFISRVSFSVPKCKTARHLRPVERRGNGESLGPAKLPLFKNTEKGVPDGFFLTSYMHKIHRRRSSVNFRGARHFCPKNMYEKLTKCLNFTRFLPDKNSKIPKLL